MVSAETAVVLPVLLFVAAVAACVPALVGTRVACTDAAREAALLVARGEDPQRARQVVARLVPGGQLAVRTSDGLVEAEVVDEVHLAPIAGASITVRGSAVAVVEP
jgi:Flp pilus assembly protein TadG